MEKGHTFWAPIGRNNPIGLRDRGDNALKREEGNTEFVSGLISGLVAQSELTELLDKLYGSHNLLEELYTSRNLTSLDRAGRAASRVLYKEVASIFG